MPSPAASPVSASSNSAEPVTHYLVVPGLLGPLPGGGEAAEPPPLPYLQRLLARAEQSSAPLGFAQTLFDLFGLDVPSDADVPTAAVCYQAEDAAEPLHGAYLMHADPLYLRPDQDRLLAYDFHRQPLSLDESRELAAAFNAHFADDGLKLLVPHPQRCYLAVDHVPQLRTYPLVEVLARNVDLFLPRGKDAPRWHGWLNEVQMLLHALPLNQRREAQGKLPVKGLWFSGGGSLPAGPVRGYRHIQGECRLLAGLDAMSSSRREAALQVDHAPERALCEGDLAAWVSALRNIERQLSEAGDEGLCLMPCDGRAWHWQPGMRRRFWRRTRPLAGWLIAGAETRR